MTPLKNSEKPIGISKINKKKNTYVISLTNETNLSLLEDQMVEYQISINRRFTLDEVEQIKKDSKGNLWYYKCLVHISYKLRTKKEIYDFLSKDIELQEDAKLKIIDKLIKHHYIDDYEYAKHFLEDCKNKKRGKRYFVNQLNRLGVDSHIIQEILEEYNEEELLEELIDQFQKIELTLINYPIVVQKRKIQEKMARKGLSTSIISKVINSIDYSEDLSKSFQKDLEKIKKKTSEDQLIIKYLLSKGYNYNYIKSNLK